MAFYIICGKPDCERFAHATYVSYYLHEHLPNFKYKKIEKSKQEWPDYVMQLNKKFKWHMVDSPIVWKEISAWGSKPYLIGGLGEFWEYCYSYYGLESFIPKAELQKLVFDNVAYFESEKVEKERHKYNVIVTLFGADHQIEFTTHLLEEIINIPYFLSNNGVFVRMYFEEDVMDPTKTGKTRNTLEDIAAYYNSLALFGNKPIAEVVDNDTDAIKLCDLLLILNDYSQTLEEGDYLIWMKRCIANMSMLGETINICAKRELKVIVCSEGPSCFMATALLQFSTVLVPSNIVALAAHKGLPVIRTVSEITKIPVSRIGAPPVWGFLGVNQYIDEGNMIFKAHITRPYARALTASSGSTIPLGTTVPELRLMSYKLPFQHQEITDVVESRMKSIQEKLHRKSFLPKVIALKSLLNLWYTGQPKDEIISLGVCSNGEYGIPPGIVFAQPAVLNEKRRWIPFRNFPLADEATLSKVTEFVREAFGLLWVSGIEIYESANTLSVGSEENVSAEEFIF